RWRRASLWWRVPGWSSPRSCACLKPRWPVWPSSRREFPRISCSPRPRKAVRLFLFLQIDPHRLGRIDLDVDLLGPGHEAVGANFDRVTPALDFEAIVQATEFLDLPRERAVDVDAGRAGICLDPHRTGGLLRLLGFRLGVVAAAATAAA